MAILRYTDAQGNVVKVNSYKVNNILVSQSKGQSEAEVMSQKAVTDSLDNLDSSIDDITTDIDGINNEIEGVKDTIAANKILCDSAINATNQEIANAKATIATKADKTSVYTKTESDEKFLTEIPEEYITETELTAKDYATKTEVDDRITQLINNAPEALDTLGEIATQLGEDSDAIAAINAVLAGKADKDDVYTKEETYNKDEVNDLLMTYDCGTY